MSGPASGYDFVRLPDRVNRVDRGDHNRFDRRLEGLLFGAVTLTYTADRPVHVGSGYKAVHGKDVVRTAARSGETLVVPGSSMKGALRGRFEALTCSCTLFGPPLGGKQRRVVSQSFPHVKEAELAYTAQGHDAFKTRREGCSAGRLCPACALFGYQSGQHSARGRLSVGDFASDRGAETERIAPQFSPRLHHLGDFEVRGGRFNVSSVHGRKFYVGRGPEAPGKKQVVEVIPAGATLIGRLTLFNVQPAELAAVLSAAGFQPGMLFKVGAGKGLGFGRLHPTNVDWNLRDHRRAPIQPDPAAWRAALEGSADYHAAGEQKLVQIHTRGDC